MHSVCAAFLAKEILKLVLWHCSDCSLYNNILCTIAHARVLYVGLYIPSYWVSLLVSLLVSTHRVLYCTVNCKYFNKKYTNKYG